MLPFKCDIGGTVGEINDNLKRTLNMKRRWCDVLDEQRLLEKKNMNLEKKFIGKQLNCSSTKVKNKIKSTDQK